MDEGKKYNKNRKFLNISLPNMDKGKKYKHFKAFKKMNRGMGESLGKRGQVAIFVIIALMIIGVLVAVFLFTGIGDVFVSDNVNPTSYLSKCVEEEVDNAILTLSKQGGYLEPDHYVTYQGEKIQYLCYTSENYEPCFVQQPMIKQHFEDEITKIVEPKAQACVRDLEVEYEARGFDVTTRPGDASVVLSPGEVVIDFQTPMTLSKESTQTFRKFGVSRKSEIYDLLMTATSIVQFEATLGDSETLLYIQYYPDLKIEKTKRDGDTIYTLSNVVTGESFTFATRSLVWPPGYGLEESLK